MKHEADIARERVAVDPAAVAIARADLAAGRGVSHDVVKHWFLTWGKPGQVPFREWLNRQNG